MILIQGEFDSIFGVIWITMLTLQIGNPVNMGVMSSFGRGLHTLSALVDFMI